MRLSKELAESYVSYRNRYLFGTQGVYNPDRTNISCSIPNIYFQQKNQPVPFLRHIGRSVSKAGTYLNVDALAVDNRDNPEVGLISNIKHGDNTIYCSFAAMNFAAEYAVTLQKEPLQICLNIIKAFQRLGSYQKGFNESTDNAPHGYIIRSDSPDENDSTENICVWNSNPDNARNLEPSYDQYCALLSSLRIIQKILDDIPPVVGHENLRDQLEEVIVERVNASVMYLAGSFWTILWFNKSNQPRMAKRGPFCIHAAYPFAKIAALVATTNYRNFFFGQFPLKEIPDFSESEILNPISQTIKSGLRDSLFNSINDFILEKLIDVVISNVIGDSINEVLKFIGGSSEVRGEIKSVLVSLIDVTGRIANLVDILTQKVLSWSGISLGSAAIPFSILLHRYYSKYMLQELQDSIFMELGELLALLGIQKPNNPDFDFSFSISFSVASAPDWWPSIWSWDGWEEDFDEQISVVIDLNLLWKIPIPIGLIDYLGILVSGVSGLLEKKPDLQMLLFLNNVASETFTENQINPVETSFDFQNCLMMAATYRMFPSFFRGGGANDNLRKFRSVMELLNTTPESFPNDRLQSAPWNQNFRWMRGSKAEDAGANVFVYSGMDFMLPLMLVASSPDDIGHNRKVLLDAMAPVIRLEEEMGPFKLPFQGPYTERKLIFSPKTIGTQADTIIYIGVVFNRGRGTGEVTIYYFDLSGEEKEETFSPNDPAKMISVPLQNSNVTAKITSNIMGYFLVESST